MSVSLDIFAIREQIFPKPLQSTGTIIAEYISFVISVITNAGSCFWKSSLQEVMSGHGGHRPGSGRKRIYSSQKERNKIWHRGHTRIALDNIVYSSWFSAKIKCGYSSDSDFASHLLSLEWRRRSVSNTAVYWELSQLCQIFDMCFKSRLYYFRQNDPVVSCGKRKRSEENVTSKRLKRHIEGNNFTFTQFVFPRVSMFPKSLL